MCWEREKSQKQGKKSKKHAKLFSVRKHTFRHPIDPCKGLSESPRPIFGRDSDPATAVKINPFKMSRNFGQFRGQVIMYSRYMRPWGTNL